MDNLEEFHLHQLQQAPPTNIKPTLETAGQAETSSTQGQMVASGKGKRKGKARSKRKLPADADPETATICGPARLAELYTASRNPHGTNLTLGARYLAEILYTSMEFAFFGGYAMTVRGMRRSTVDIDVLVNTDTQSMIDVLTKQRYILYPEDRLVGNFPPDWNRTVFHIYMDTGTLDWLYYEYEIHVQPQIVSAYLILCCDVVTYNMSLPPDLSRATDHFNLVPGRRKVRVIGISWQLMSKLRAYYVERIGRSSHHFHDIAYLTSAFSLEICTWRMGLPLSTSLEYLDYALAFLHDLAVEMKLDVITHKRTVSATISMLRKLEDTLTWLPFTTLESFNDLTLSPGSLSASLAPAGANHYGLS
ncbi:hypothetical protein F5X99DRAFT_405489 [Biscogniauxia marginata]|nr:hypothetical protein F5X99DRAFT_405489 [Biscogniauxia marginata]